MHELLIHCFYVNFCFSPLELIRNTEALLYKMCKNSGEFDSLLALAKAKHELVDVL